MRGGRDDAGRFRILRILMLAAGIVLAGRIIHIQVFQHEALKKKGLAQWESLVSITAERGNLYDRHGQPLALSVTTWRVGVSASLVTQPDTLSTLLAEVLGQDAGGIRQKIRRADNSHFVLEQDAVLTAADKKRLRAFNAVTMEVRHSRLYPADGVGASLIGFYSANKDESIAEGLELSLNGFLAGQEGLARRQKNADPLDQMGNVNVREPVHGQSLVLSLDTELQIICEQELARSVKEYGAKSGSVLIMDPNTGDILSAASFPIMKTRGARNTTKGIWNNRNFTWQYEPGSVSKIFTTASLLRNSAVDMATVFNCDKVKGDGVYVRNDRHHKYGHLSLLEAFAVSSNVYFAKAVGNLTQGEFYRDLTDFGFGQPTSMPYRGQPKGILHPVSTWSGRSMQTLAIGQEMAVTPLQLGMAVCSVANGGTLYAPRMVKEIRDDKGQVLEVIDPVPLRRVMAPQLADVLREAMGRVVLEGTGQGAGMDWITTGGKTGTAQKCVVEGKGYTPGAYVASFAGIVPLENPRLVILTILDEPEGIHHYAAQSAVPLYASIIKSIRRSTDWLTDVPGARTSSFTPRDRKEMVAVPDVLHLSVNRASQRLGEAGFQVLGAEKDGMVIQQVPGPGTKCEPGQTVTLAVTDPEGKPGAAATTCPDFTGMSNREVSSLAAKLGIPVVIKGVGYAVGQSADPKGAPGKKPVIVKMIASWQ
jgi:stage V sporulation protein D (sporulation-specific penicillin-binding protein)